MRSVCAALIVAVLAVVPVGTSAATPVKVGLVTDIGGLNDRSFNQLSYEGLQRAKSELGVQTGVVQSTSQNDYVPNLTNFARSGYHLVIAVGFLMKDATEQVAKDFPKTQFLLIDDVIKDRPNVTSAVFSTEQCGYLVGALAALVDQDASVKLPGLRHTGTIGVVGGIQIPPVDRYIAGYYEGAWAINPKVKVLRGYTGNFNDPASGKALALAQHSRGADIIFQVAGGTGEGVIQAAKAQGFLAIGVDSDQAYLAPSNVLTSAMKRVDTSVFLTAKRLRDGTLAGGIETFDLQNGGVGIGAILKGVPAGMTAKVDALKRQITSGTVKVSPAIPAAAGK
ncbi:MAG TPA: BMP family ABC transporter substrate-binding protein [bacterium]|nr:BMP family ABC transporter substrate-binding protein [bacterium]